MEKVETKYDNTWEETNWSKNQIIKNDSKTIYEDEKDAVKETRKLRNQGYHSFSIKRTEPTGDTKYYITGYRPDGQREEEF